MNKAFTYVLTICLTTCVVIGLLILLLYPLRDPLVYSVQPFSLDKAAYTTNDTMIIHSYRCNRENAPLVVATKELYFYNLRTGERYDMPSSTGPVQTGCSWQEARVIDGFHPDMPSGRYVKRGVTVAQGRFRNSEVQWITEQFEYTKVR